MNAYTIRVYQNDVIVKTYENVVFAHIVKFEYLNMLAKRKNTIDILYSNSNAIIYTLDAQIYNVTSSEACTSELYNASKYLQSNIFTMFLFDIETNEYDIIKKFSDVEIKLFFSGNWSEFLTFSEYMKNTRNIREDEPNKYSIMLNVFKLDNLINFDYFVGWNTKVFNDSLSLQEYANIIENNKNISKNLHPRLWWLQQVINENVDNLIEFLPIILKYCKHTLAYTLPQLPNKVLTHFFSYEKSEIASVLKTSCSKFDNIVQFIEPFIESDNISIKKLSYRSKLLLYNYTNNIIISNNIIVELIYSNYKILNDDPSIEINYNKINLPKAPLDVRKYYNFFKKNQKKIMVEYKYLIDCLLLLANDVEFIEKSIFDNNIYGNFFDVPEYFFTKIIFLKKIKYQKISSSVYVRTGTKILTRDILTNQIFVPIPNTHINKKLESIDNISFNIQEVYPIGNKLYFGDKGYLEILENAFISFCVQFEDYIIGYFSDGDIEKICLIYNNKIKLFFSESMFSILLDKNNALYRFIELHCDDNRLLIENSADTNNNNLSTDDDEIQSYINYEEEKYSSSGENDMNYNSD